LGSLKNSQSLGKVSVHFGIETSDREIVCLVLARDELGTQLQKCPNALLCCCLVRGKFRSRRATQAQPPIDIWGDFGVLGDDGSKKQCPEVFYGSVDGGPWETGRACIARLGQNGRDRPEIGRRKVLWIRRFCDESQGIPILLRDSDLEIVTNYDKSLIISINEVRMR
jgi:hypothetical protein